MLDNSDAESRNNICKHSYMTHGIPGPRKVFPDLQARDNLPTRSPTSTMPSTICHDILIDLGDAFAIDGRLYVFANQRWTVEKTLLVVGLEHASIRQHTGAHLLARTNKPGIKA